jgi:hypothetical protein
MNGVAFLPRVGYLDCGKAASIVSASQGDPVAIGGPA